MLIVRDEINSVISEVQSIKDESSFTDLSKVSLSLQNIKAHTSKAREATEDPIWKTFEMVPFVGNNLFAISETAVIADDITGQAALPLLAGLDSIEPGSLAPKGAGVDLAVLREIIPKLASTAAAFQLSYDRLQNIDESSLIPPLAEPIKKLRSDLEPLHGGIASAAAAGELLPSMLGGEGARNYLLLIQNSSELRATGGISGALALVTADEGHLTLSSQDSASGLGAFTPPLEVDSEQRQLYSDRIGTHMQDVNLTPEFPTAAETAKKMWDLRHPEQPADGVIAIDTMVLANLLHATGPVALTDPAVLELVKETRLPLSLSADNVVSTLLSSVYREIEDPEIQDVYFAAVASAVFEAITHTQSDGLLWFDAFAHSEQDQRLHFWSSRTLEQDLVGRTSLAGSVSGQNGEGAKFGVYFNDGTGAKMDYYVRRSVQLIQACPVDGYGEFTVRVTATNEAPADAASSLPAYVTGGGAFGVDPGKVRTNYVFYGPSQAFVETAFIDGRTIPVGTGKHGKRPVGTVSLELGPGESATIDMVFSKVVENAEPQLRITPTIQSLVQVVRPLERETCS